jgi:hypothetical protein
MKDPPLIRGGVAAHVAVQTAAARAGVVPAREAHFATTLAARQAASKVVAASRSTAVALVVEVKIGAFEALAAAAAITEAVHAVAFAVAAATREVAGHFVVISRLAGIAQVLFTAAVACVIAAVAEGAPKGSLDYEPEHTEDVHANLDRVAIERCEVVGSLHV